MINGEKEGNEILGGEREGREKGKTRKRGEEGK